MAARINDDSRCLNRDDEDGPKPSKTFPESNSCEFDSAEVPDPPWNPSAETLLRIFRGRTNTRRQKVMSLISKLHLRGGVITHPFVDRMLKLYNKYVSQVDVFSMLYRRVSHITMA